MIPPGRLLIAFIGLFSLNSCEESLPVRRDPTDLFKVQVQAQYNYTQFANVVFVQLVAINEFDETLSDHIGVDGTITVTSDRDTSVRKTFTLSRLNLIHGTYDPYTATLTINPGDSVVLQVSWDFTDDAGNSLDSAFFHYSVDRTCKQRMVAELEKFTVFGRSKLYTNLGYAQSQIPFLIQKYNIFVGPHDCLPL
ncbi:MAG TPA: hypothetical protein VI758_00940 [Bacteroidota bacterium]